MNRKEKIYTTIGLATVLVNGLHSLWHLAFTSTIWLIIFKFGLVIYWLLEMIKAKPKFKIPMLIYRLLLLVGFVLLLGIPKMNIGIQPFSGRYKVIEVCTSGESTLNKPWKMNRLERSIMDYGLYDSKEKTEVVIPLFLIFDWRFETTDITMYRSKYRYCKFLGKGESY